MCMKGEKTKLYVNAFFLLLLLNVCLDESQPLKSEQSNFRIK